MLVVPVSFGLFVFVLRYCCLFACVFGFCFAMLGDESFTRIISDCRGSHTYIKPVALAQPVALRPVAFAQFVALDTLILEMLRWLEF